jgi:hypothetical protein
VGVKTCLFLSTLWEKNCQRMEGGGGTVLPTGVKVAVSDQSQNVKN